MKALDLFCGLGCYTLALRDAGIEVVGAAERDPWRADAYREHFPSVPVYADVAECIAAHPDADLWTACAGVAELGALVTRDALPRWLWLESVRESFASIEREIFGRHPWSDTFDAHGRRHLLAGQGILRVPEWPPLGLQHPDKDKRHGVSWEAQEEALGLPRGWTAAAGATERERHQAIASTSNMAVLRAVAAAIMEAGK